MNDVLIYPSLLIVSGLLVSTLVIIFLAHASRKITRHFQLYPESRGILNFSLEFISWFIGLVVFLLFLRLALRLLGLEFTQNVVETVILSSPKYIIATLLILAGFYVSRVIRDKTSDHKFEYKSSLLLVGDFIINLTFVFTALYTIGVQIVFFVEFYRTVLWTTGAIVALIISMTVGIPLGMTIYERAKKEGKAGRIKKRSAHRRQ